MTAKRFTLTKHLLGRFWCCLFAAPRKALPLVSSLVPELHPCIGIP